MDGNPRTMTTIGDHGQESHKPLHVGDSEAAMWGIEKDPLLRQTMTAILLLDRPPDRDVLLDRLERVSRTLPAFRHRLVEVPLRLSTPRWLVDPNFDLSYHVRWIGAPGDGSIDGVFEFARQSTMSGLDRDRPLWTVTVVEGLQRGEAALIIKMDHVLTDGLGVVLLVACLSDPTREPRDLGVLPAIPEPESQSPFDLAVEAVTNSGRRIAGVVGRSGNSATRAIPAAVLRPVDTARGMTRNMRALGRILTPPLKTLSPLMTERRGWMRFTAFESDLESLRKAAKPHGCTVNDAFVAAVAHGFALYHQRHGEPVERLRAEIVVNVREQGDSSLGNHVMGAAIALPVGADDPAGAMTTYHGLIDQLKQDVRLPLATGIPMMLNALGPLLQPFFGTLMKHGDFAAISVPAGDETIYLAGGEVIGLYPFGPLVGVAANCTLVGYRHKAFVGINVDAAAVPDLDMLAGCIREGFDAVIALADAGR